MNNDFSFLAKPVMNYGHTVSHSIKDYFMAHDQFCCCTFIEKDNILVKGEWGNKRDSRKALLVFFDLETGGVHGGTSSLVCSE